MSGLDLTQAVVSPPRGVHSNFETPPNEAALAYSTLAIALIMVTLFSWFRFLVKLCIVQKLHVEDYLIPFAWLAAIGQIACGFILYQFAPIIHSWDMRMRTFGRYLLWYRLSAIFYNIAIILIKVSMLVQVLRIFVPRGSQSKTYYIIHALIWANTLYYATATFLMIFTCRPIPKAWQPWLPGTCMETGTIAMATAAVNLTGDLSILFLTQKIIWNLMRVERKQRMKLSVVFCAGIVPCGFAVMCLYYNDRQMHSGDFTRDSALMGIACYGEVASGMFVLFLPVVPRFFTHVREHTSFSLSVKHHHAFPQGGIEFSEAIAPPRQGVEPKERQKKQSLWHISYTQRNSDDTRPIIPSLRTVDLGPKSLGFKSQAESVGEQSL